MSRMKSFIRVNLLYPSVSVRKNDESKEKSPIIDWKTIYVCDQCSSSFDLEKNMFAHKAKCIGKTSFIKVKPRTTIPSSSGLRHDKVKKETNLSYRLKCSLCFKQFPSTEKSDEHILHEHQGQRFITVNGKPKCILQYMCRCCLTEFTSESLVNDHFVSVHKVSNQAKFEVKEEINQYEQLEYTVEKATIIDPLRY